MNKKIVYVGLDVDDQNFHGAALSSGTGEIIEFKCRPTVAGLEKSLKKVKKVLGTCELKVCYEATYIGFTLQRDLAKLGIHCDVIAPSSTPRRYGNQVKTDRIDAKKLAEFYASNLLDVIDVPEVEREMDRDLLRSREQINCQLRQIRTHIQSLLRRNGLHFKGETGNGTYWTPRHLSWVERKIEEAKGSFKTNLSLLYQQMKWLLHTRIEYDKCVEEMAGSEKYKEQVKALIVYKGIKNLYAMTMITEIGSIRRFSHPGQLVSWMGMDIREYSSGGSSHRFGITKQGNRYLRTAFVEANQTTFRSSKVGKDLKQRRKGVDPELIHIADRCMKRLSTKGTRMYHAGKHYNVVKVACAREMVGFVWESLNKIAA